MGRVRCPRARALLGGPDRALGGPRRSCSFGGLYRAPSESMAPTIAGRRPLRDPRASARREVGDIVVFHPPARRPSGDVQEMCGGGPPPRGAMCAKPASGAGGVTFVKRIVADGGDQIAMRDGKIVRNGSRGDHRGPAGLRGRRLRLPARDHRARRPLLHARRQPRRLRRLALLGPRPRGLGHRALLVRRQLAPGPQQLEHRLAGAVERGLARPRSCRRSVLCQQGKSKSMRSIAGTPARANGVWSSVTSRLRPRRGNVAARADAPRGRPQARSTAPGPSPRSRGIRSRLSATKSSSDDGAQLVGVALARRPSSRAGR